MQSRLQVGNLESSTTITVVRSWCWEHRSMYGRNRVDDGTISGTGFGRGRFPFNAFDSRQEPLAHFSCAALFLFSELSA